MKTLCAFAALVCLASTLPAALIDVWRADDLSLNDGDVVGTWTSASNRTMNAVLGERPTFRRNITSGATSAVRFNRHFMSGSSPVGGRNAFSIAFVFQATAAGANDNAQWYGKSGIVDAEQGGVTLDWGTVIEQNGQVGLGTGNPDVSSYSTGPSLVDGNYHAAVFTWGGGAQAVYVDSRVPTTQAGVSAAARNNAGMAFGGIFTGEGGANRRFVGDLVEVRFYDTALTALQASNVIQELRDTHVLGNLPRIFSFTSNTNPIYLGQSATLSWNVSNATSVVIDQGIGSVALIGSTSVSPTATTTYTLTATNENGQRSASFTLTVDPGVPTALPLTTNVAQGSSLPLTLQGTDPNGGPLTYALVDLPTHGSLTGTPPNVTYTPTAGYFGFDAFTFKVNDGAFDSAPATVTIKVVPPPAPPTAIILSSTTFPAGAGPGAFIAALRAADVNEEDTHIFTLVSGFSDNAMFTVSGNQLLAGPSFVGGSGVSRSIRLRATDSAALFLEQTFTLTSVEASETIVINEIHYNSPNNTILEEFIELYNPTDAAVDISNWRIRGGVDYFFPANTSIPARGFVVVAEHPPTIASRYGRTAFGPWDGGINNEGEEITLRNALNDVVDVVDFDSEFPWPIAADGEGASMQLVNPSLDNDLGSSWRGGRPPTPGATNVIFATNAAPNIRQVNHTPEQPRSTNSVVITCKVTDPEGVASVTLSYQVVNPGNFIPSILPLAGAQLNTTNPNLTNAPNPAFEASTNWTTVTMTDPDGDGIYTVTLPQRAHRTLVRYRITVTDSLGASRRAPFEDDPSLNFAYFVYDDMPTYQGFSPAVLQSLPVFTLITRDVDMNQCTAWFAPFNNGVDQLPQNSTGGARNEGRLHFNWEGAIVYDGVVYDHVTYRLRGANGRYHNGKRSFRIRFKDGKLLDAKDQYGRRFPTKWRELTTGKGQSNRGSESFALNEVINYFLWNKVGVPAPLTLHFHFRVIRAAQENPTDQYAGDFWGLNWAQEKYDVRFLEAHDLPRGNLYKLVDNFVLGLDELRYQAAFAPTNAADFFNIENTLTGFQSREWLEANANYPAWYRYHAIAEAIRHYDIWPSANKNGAWYFEPIYTAANNFLGRMWQLPYDSTDTWGPTWNTGEDVLYNGIFATTATGGDAGQNPEMQKEYRNAVREIRDLLFQPDQINSVIDAFATPLLPFAQADFGRWRNAPSPSGYSSIMIPGSPGAASGLAAYAQDMKNFMFNGGTNIAWWIDRTTVSSGGWVTRLDQIANADTLIPARPTITYAGVSGFPADGLVFQSSAFSDPDGNDTFGAVQWRVAQVLGPGEVAANPDELRLEWDAAWDSGELASFNEFITVPGALIEPERMYRARVRHKDNTGRWSRWSLPVELRPRAADIAGLLRANLVISEIMYNPPPSGIIDGDEFEFLELRNIGANILDLTGLSFTAGINFAFTNDTRLAPGATFLLARNPPQLATRYPAVIVNGLYTGALNNAGETITISHLVAGEILSLAYDDRTPWPVTADGFGYSLVLANGTYAASVQPLGTPGSVGAASAIAGVVINEVLTSSTLPLRDYIELHNTTGADIDIAGWYLTDDPTFPWKYRIPTGTILSAGGYLLFDETQFNPTPGIGNSFSLSSFGDDAYLFSSSAPGQLTGYSHGFEFDGAQDGVSFGRYINSVGAEQFPPQLDRTTNAANSGPRFGPPVISEIHYHPRNPNDEFLELHNPADSWAFMFSDYGAGIPTNSWQMNGLGGYVFPWVAIPPGGYLLLIAEDPDAFRARWNISPTVEILQHFGNLQDSGENLRLEAPDIPATNGVAYFTVDAVRYNDRRPWPLAADGGGASLQRLNALTYGDDPMNWAAARPTPGGPRLAGTVPSILAQPQPAIRTNAVGGFATLTVNAAGSAPLSYQWRFNSDNIDDATNSTLLLQDLQLENAGRYSVVVFNNAGSTESSNVTLVVRVGVSITGPPTNALVRIPPDPAAAPTTNATFFVTAATFNPPISYQWQFNGADIPGATGSSQTVNNVTLADEGAYRVIVTDQIGSVPSPPAFLYPLITPRIVLNPIPQSAVQGQVISLSAEGTGNPLPFGWEWRRMSTVLVSNTVNERTAFHEFANTNASGSTIQYRVVLRNLAGQANVTLNIVTLTDADADGLPDAWEAAYSVAADPAQDADLDGMSNLQEYRAGTDPTSATSILRLNLSADGTLSFDAVSNKTYTVQQTESLAAPWTKLTDIMARTNIRAETVSGLIGPTNHLFRAVTPRQP